MAIQPVATEEEWEPIWTQAQVWAPSGAKLLIVSPHPDDETLACGGLISRQRADGQAVEVVAVTDGERAYDCAGDLAQTRRGEQKRALEALGVEESKITRLALPDGGLAARQKLLLERMLPLCSADTHVLAPWTGDFHPDHETCGRAARQAAERTGAALTFYFFWTWHRGTPALLDGMPLRSLALTPAQREAKLQALSEYRSQLYHPPEDPILPEPLLWPAKRAAEIFLAS